MAKLTDQIVLITGCSSGIGEALARAFSRAGHRVVATARRPETLDGLCGHVALTLPLDVTSVVSIQQTVDTAIERLGAIDILINNAGYALIGPVAEIDLDDLRLQLETNVVGAIAVCQAVIPHMAERGSGRIVNVGSVSGVTTTPYSGAYCGSKAALHAAGDALRMEVEPFGIEVITVQPGAIESRFGSTASHGLERYRMQSSLYSAVASSIQARAELSQQNATPAEAFARKVVDKVTAPKPPWLIRYGHGSRLLPFLGKLPTRLRDRFLKHKFGLDQL